MVLCNVFLTKNRFLSCLCMPSNILRIACRWLVLLCLNVFTHSIWMDSTSLCPNSVFEDCIYDAVHYLWRRIGLPKKIPLEVGDFLFSITCKLWIDWWSRLYYEMQIWNTLALVWRILGITSDYYMVDCVSCLIIHEKTPKFCLTRDVTHLVTTDLRMELKGTCKECGRKKLTGSSSRLLNFRVTWVDGRSLAAGVNESLGTINKFGHLLMPHNSRLWLQSGFKYRGTS